MFVLKRQLVAHLQLQAKIKSIPADKAGKKSSRY